MDDLGDVRAYYERDEERDRLGSAIGVIGFERTKEILARALPTPRVSRWTRRWPTRGRSTSPTRASTRCCCSVRCATSDRGSRRRRGIAFAFAATDLDERLETPDGLELIGLGPHLLATARRPLKAPVEPAERGGCLPSGR